MSRSPSKNSFSFGLGREETQKYYVGDIYERAKKPHPSPQQYEPLKPFGSDGKHYSIKHRMKRYGIANMKEKMVDPYKLELESKLPGPGHYSSIDNVGVPQ